MTAADGPPGGRGRRDIRPAGADRVGADAGRSPTRTDRAGAQSDPAGADAGRSPTRADPAGAQSDPAGADAGRSPTRADPAGAQSDPAGADAGRSPTRADPAGGHTNPQADPSRARADPARDARTVVYTDGACLGNPGPGGWAWAVPGGPYASGAEPVTTNQRMEIRAVLEAARHLPGLLEVMSDSAYVVNCWRDRWWERWLLNRWRNARKEPVANRDLWEPLVAEFQSGRIRMRWVKGHGGDPMNDLVDRLAVEAASTQRGRSGTGTPDAVGPPDEPGRTPARRPPGTGLAPPGSPAPAPGRAPSQAAAGAAASGVASGTEPDISGMRAAAEADTEPAASGTARAGPGAIPAVATPDRALDAAAAARLPTGHRIVVGGLRPPELGGYDTDNPVASEVRRRLTEVLAARREAHADAVVLTGLGLGAEQLGAEAAREAGVPYVAVLAYPGQDAPWPTDAKRRFARLLANAATTVTLQPDPPPSRQHAGAALRRRDAWLARHANEAVVVWDGRDAAVGRLVGLLRDELGEDNVRLVEPPAG